MFFKPLTLLSLVVLAIFTMSCATSKNSASTMQVVPDGQAKPNEFWWPSRLSLNSLRDHDEASNPYGKNFDYAREFAKLDLKAVKRDINKALTSSQDWWPADYGNYGPFFIRMAWHAAGTYRISDGRGGAAGGQLRFEPLQSWPDNTSLDKARRLLWPIKKKYGRKISWGDLMVLTGTVAMENMGFKTYGFAGGRADDWEPDLVYWGPEGQLLARQRHKGKHDLTRGLAASRMGLIYVNPEGPDGVPDPLAAAKEIRQTFARMAMNDEETVALIAGGHTFGKAHGAHKADKCLGPDPTAAPLEQQGLGWKNSCGKGHSEDTITSGLEGAWTQAPVSWSNLYLTNLYAFDWVQTRSPNGAIQWVPADGQAEGTVPDAHIEGKRHAPIMFTTDLALKEDPIYREITSRWVKNPQEFADAFARAWFKLTHRDMGPKRNYLGSEVPQGDLIWQDPIPARNYELINESEIESLKAKILDSGLSTQALVRAAWASASSYRATDKRGGANGARIRLAPQKDWEANDPEELSQVLSTLSKVRDEFNKSLTGGKQVSMADTIVLAGNAAVERAVKQAGYDYKVPFQAGRTDATVAQTDADSFDALEPEADGFRNYFDKSKNYRSPPEMLVDKADKLNLTVPEMTVLVGGMRALGANHGGAKHGIFTTREGTLSNDFFVNLLDMSTEWRKSASEEGIYEGFDRKSGKRKWTATPVDLIFGAHSELRAVSEVYASNDGRAKMAWDFTRAWHKVMNADRL